jgi:hypothetical protein
MMNKINPRLIRQHIGNTSCIYLNNKSSINIAIHSLFPGLNSNLLAFSSQIGRGLANKSNLNQELAVSYPNAELLKNKITEDNRKKTGIYRWTNNLNGSCYVGSAVNLTKRLNNYFSPDFLRKELDKGNSIIYKALLKLGYSHFKLDILKYCDPIHLIQREQYYINKLNPEYNILKIAGSSVGFKHSIATKDILREKVEVGFIQKIP